MTARLPDRLIQIMIAPTDDDPGVRHTAYTTPGMSGMLRHAPDDHVIILVAGKHRRMVRPAARARLADRLDRGQYRPRTSVIPPMRDESGRWLPGVIVPR